MPSKNYEPKTRGTPPYLRKIRLDMRIKRKPLKFCPSCRETSEFVTLLFSKVNKIEEIINKVENFLEKATQMEIDNHFEYALYCSSDWDPMDLD
jgi:hypothetical protein